MRQVVTLGHAAVQEHRLLGPDDTRCSSFADLLINQREPGKGTKSFAVSLVHRIYAAVFNLDFEFVAIKADNSTSTLPSVFQDDYPHIRAAAVLYLPWTQPLHMAESNGTCV